jgi:hypothetical protein
MMTSLSSLRPSSSSRASGDMENKTFYADDKFVAVIECLESMGFTRVGSAGGECSLVYTNLVCTGCTFIGFCLIDAAS